MNISQVFRLGINQETPKYIIPRIIVSNQLALICLILNLLTLPLILLISSSKVLVVIFCINIVCYCLVIFCNLLGLDKFARLLLIFINAFVAGLLHILSMPNPEETTAGLLALQVSFVIIPWLIFDLREKLLTSLGILMTTLPILCLGIVRQNLLWEVDFSFFKQSAIETVFYLFSFLMISFGLYFLQKQAKNSKDESEKLLLDIEAKNLNLQKTEQDSREYIHQLEEAKHKEKERTWASEGMVLFSELLRIKNGDIEELGNYLLAELVNYLQANQAGMFILRDEKANQPEKYLDLVACYAFDRKKFLKKEVGIYPEHAEGLLGQVFLEQKSLYLQQVPKDYTTITSGLGDAKPNSLFIVPLITNSKVYGVIEIASFNAFKQYQIDFIENLSESIASTIANVKVNNHTKKLLELSQEQGEQVRVQEEEMRQNMEELQTTQEELNKQAQEMKSYLNGINKSLASIEFDLKGNILTANENFLNVVKYELDEIKGKHHQLFVSKEYASSDEYAHFWKALGQGGEWVGEVERICKNGNNIWLNVSYTSVLNLQQEPYKIIKYAIDITAQKRLSLNLDNQLNAINRSTAFIEFDLQGRIIDANDKFMQIVGYREKSEVIGKHHNIFINQSDYDETEHTTFWAKLQQGEFISGEFKRKNAIGKDIWIQGNYNPISDSDGKPYKVIKYAHDITLLKQSLEKINVLDNHTK